MSEYELGWDYADHVAQDALRKGKSPADFIKRLIPHLQPPLQEGARARLAELSAATSAGTKGQHA